MTGQILIIEDPPKALRPKGALRADVAWKLFLPDTLGDISSTGRRGAEKLTTWIWNELSEKMGYMNPDSRDQVVIICPGLTPKAKEYVLRTCSFWSDEIYIPGINGEEIDMNNKGENLWLPPIVNVINVPDKQGALSIFHEDSPDGNATMLSPLLGSAHSFVRVYSIYPGKTYSRFHSHSLREEFYLILEGKGSVRIGNHKTEVRKGDLIAKPTGPDTPTQLLADLNETMRVMDMEIWPQKRPDAKELVSYPDHNELLFLGSGWNSAVPGDVMISARDLFNNYKTGYIRKMDGTWEPSEVPGFRTRKIEK